MRNIEHRPNLNEIVRGSFSRREKTELGEFFQKSKNFFSVDVLDGKAASILRERLDFGGWDRLSEDEQAKLLEQVKMMIVENGFSRMNMNYSTERVTVEKGLMDQEENKKKYPDFSQRQKAIKPLINDGLTQRFCEAVTEYDKPFTHNIDKAA